MIVYARERFLKFRYWEAHSGSQFMLHCSHCIGRGMSTTTRNSDYNLYGWSLFKLASYLFVSSSLLCSPRKVTSKGCLRLSCSDENNFGWWSIEIQFLSRLRAIRAEWSALRLHNWYDYIWQQRDSNPQPLSL